MLREGTAEEAGILPDHIARIRDCAARWVEEDLSSALVLLAARRGVVCLHEAWGVLDGNRKAPPLTLDALFPVASMSKPVTATAILLLTEEGAINLNSPLRRYVPEVSGEGTQDVLVHQLLTHTSGFTDETLNEFATIHAKEHPQLPTLEATQHPLIHDYLHHRYQGPLALKPGTQNSYGGFNYELLAEIVRRVTGQPFAAFVEERIFAPLGMKDSSFRLKEGWRSRVVARPKQYPFAEGSTVFNLDDPQFRDAPYGSAGLLSTAWDQATFMQVFLDGGACGDTRLLSPRSIRLMTENQIPGIGAQLPGGVWLREGSWAYGFMVQAIERTAWVGSLQPVGSFYHGGTGTCCYWAEPDSGLLGVYLSTDATFDEETWESSCSFPMFQNMLSSAVVGP